MALTKKTYNFYDLEEQDYTLVDVRKGKLLDMLEDNEQKTMENAIRQLKDWDTNIRVVTTDMANQYIKWLRVLLPNATNSIDIPR